MGSIDFVVFVIPGGLLRLAFVVFVIGARPGLNLLPRVLGVASGVRNPLFDQLTTFAGLL